MVFDNYAPNYLKIQNAATATLVALAVNQRIIVLDFSLSFSGTTNIKFQSHAAPTDITGLYYGVANTVVAPGYSPIGHFTTLAGEALDINNSASVAVGGYLTYVIV